METALALDDDVFFADLSKQISLLIMDDEEEDDSLGHYPSVNLQVFNQAIHPAHQTSFMNYDQRIYNRESKGTGVFIPRSSHPRKKNVKQGKSIASGNKFQRPSDHKSRGIPQITYNNNISPSYDSFNYRRI